jgi:hypothetical protein
LILTKNYTHFLQINALDDRQFFGYRPASLAAYVVSNVSDSRQQSIQQFPHRRRSKINLSSVDMKRQSQLSQQRIAEQIAAQEHTEQQILLHQHIPPPKLRSLGRKQSLKSQRQIDIDKDQDNDEHRQKFLQRSV